MINKIIGSYILFACLLAVFFKLSGVEGTIHFGNYFRAYLVQSNRELANFKIAIPNIPLIPNFDFLEVGGEWYEVLYALVLNFVNAWSRFINGLINFLNIVITLLNVIIQTIELTFIFLKNLIIMKESVSS